MLNPLYPLASLYNWLIVKWPEFAWVIGCLQMLKMAKAQPGTSKHTIMLPPIYALCTVNPLGPVQPFLRVYGVIRPVAEMQTEIAEDTGGRLVFFTTEAAAEQEVNRRGAGWSSYEFWVDSPPEFPAC